jgi:hypothetical protein
MHCESPLVLTSTLGSLLFLQRPASRLEAFKLTLERKLRLEDL